MDPAIRLTLILPQGSDEPSPDEDIKNRIRLAAPWAAVEVLAAPAAASQCRDWASVIGRLAESRPDVLVASVLDSPEAILLARMLGRSAVGVEDQHRDDDRSEPEIMLDARTRIQRHARVFANALAQSDPGSLARAILAASSAPRSPDPAPPGLSTVRELLLQLELTIALLARDAAKELDLVRDIVLRWSASSGEAPRPQRGHRRPRVLLVTHQYSRTGAPIELFLLTQRMLASAPDLEFIVTGFEDGPMRSRFREELGVSALLVGASPPPFPFDDLLAHVDEIDPDLVVLNASIFYQEAPLLKMKGLRVIWWIHDGIHAATREGHLFTDPALATMTLHGLLHPDRLFFPAEDTRDQFVRCCPEVAAKTRHVRNGLDLESLRAARAELLPRREALRADLGIGADDFVVLCVGSFERRKNQKALVCAFQAFLAAHQEARSSSHLLFLGNPMPYATGPDVSFFDEVRSEVRSEHASRIRFLGLEPSALPRLAIADLHALVSTNESSPLANLEAMAFGIPCLSSRVHGIPEALGDGEHGFLIDPYDPDSIVAALAHAWTLHRKRDPGLAAMTARAERFVSEHHDVEATSRIVLDELRALLAVPSRDRGPLTRTRAADRRIQEQIIARWALFKGDPQVYAHLARSNCHRFFVADP